MASDDPGIPKEQPRENSHRSRTHLAARLNPSQARRVMSTFMHVDGLLKSVEDMTRPIGSPFTDEKRDLTPDEARLLQSFVDQTRTRMLAALDRLGFPRHSPTLSARHSAGTALLFAEISLSELDPRTLSGYGSLDDAAAREVAALADDLRSLMTRGRELLREREAGGLAEQVAAVPGAVGAVLRDLLKISTERGLAEVRPLLAAAAERARGATLDVGVFGRASAGKSSLINALLGSGVLPVGATPVTAVPVRISRGPTRVVVERRVEAPLEIGLADLPFFATEEHNAGNRNNVRSIEVTIPGAPEGLRLLDTPGVGSLGSSGSAQAFAWVPRCDLGLVLVPAGTPLGADEAAFVTRLVDAGIACRVLLSKCDLLTVDERPEALRYLSSELRSLVGGQWPVDVQPVSTRPGFDDTLAAFRKEQIAPLASDHARRAREALRVRLHKLVAVVAGALSGQGQVLGDADVELQKARAEAQDAIGRLCDSLSRSGPSVLRGAAQAAVEAWTRREDAVPAVRTSILSFAGAALAVVREAVDGVRSRIGVPGEASRLPPLFDPPFLEELASIPPPRYVPGVARALLARHRLAPIAAPLDEALLRYASHLRTWGDGSLETLAHSGDVAVPTPPVEGDLAQLSARIDEALSPACDTLEPAHVCNEHPPHQGA